MRCLLVELGTAPAELLVYSAAEGGTGPAAGTWGLARRDACALGPERSMSFNPLYLLATATFGFGFSLAIYRPVAARFGWPMGFMQRNHPFFVTVLGLAALVATFLFIMGDSAQRWPVLVLGLLFTLFWTGFLRVASQTSLLLTPIAGFMFGMVWASTEDGMREIRALDDKLLERASRIEQRLEDRIRGVMEKAKGWQAPAGEERNSPGSQATPGAPAAPKKTQP